MGIVRHIGLGFLLAAVPLATLAGAAQEPTLPAEFAWVKNEGELVGMRVAPSMSMAPALLADDRVAVVKLGDRAIRRGDVLLFEHPKSARYLVFIKRVVGLPGDRVQMKGGRLWLNGEIVPRTGERTVVYVNDGVVEGTTEYTEQLPGEEHPHLIHDPADDARLDETPLFVVPEGHLFMMGDSRDNSEDSRAISGHADMLPSQRDAWPNESPPTPGLDPAIGFVPADKVIGRVVTVLFSLHNCRPSEMQRAARLPCLTPNIGKRL